MNMELPSRLYVLSRLSGYPIVQRNGQRKFGPRLDWEGPAPPKGCEVFIGKLPRELFEDELVPVFSKVGVIYELRMMLNFSGSNRGYAFLNYTSVAEATAAIKLLHNYEIRPGHRIGVTRSADNCYLFIKGIPKDKSAEEVLIEMSKYIEGIVNISVPIDPLDESLNAGCVYVEFKTHRAAAMARRVLVPGFVHFFGRELSVDWAELENRDKLFEQKQVKGLNKMKYQNVQFQQCTSFTQEQQSCIYKLEEFCSHNGWEDPKYSFNKHTTKEGTETWICGLDLGMKGHMLRRIYSQACLTLYQAQHNVAQKCLNVILQVFQQKDVQNVSNMSNLSYEYETSNVSEYIYRPQSQTIPLLKIW